MSRPGIDVEGLLARGATWRPAGDDVARWAAEAEREGGPAALLHEVRWWQAWDAGRRGDWERVTALADRGLGEPFSEREALRVALLHALSGDLAQAEHVLSQAAQWGGGVGLLARFADACAAEGLDEAAARFRRISSPAPSAPRP